MARYTQASKDRVRDAVDFVELVSARTDLRRAGANSFTGLCPFHDERSPSFDIDPAQKLDPPLRLPGGRRRVHVRRHRRGAVAADDTGAEEGETGQVHLFLGSRSPGSGFFSDAADSPVSDDSSMNR